MSQVALLNRDDPIFDFEHAMQHRLVLGAMSPLTQFSVLPYLLDPQQADHPADKWNLNHQQAHDDAVMRIPQQYGWYYWLFEPHPLGYYVGGNLIDEDQNNPDQRQWWTFQNHINHYLINAQTLPGPTADMPMWVFPFW